MFIWPKKAEHYKALKFAKEVLRFGDSEIEKNNFYHQKTTILLGNVDIGKV